MKNTNWRAMQAAGSLGSKSSEPHPAPPTSVKPRYLAGGSWKQKLSDVKKGK